jgi:hypothetical protein
MPVVLAKKPRGLGGWATVAQIGHDSMVPKLQRSHRHRIRGPGDILIRLSPLNMARSTDGSLVRKLYDRRQRVADTSPSNDKYTATTNNPSMIECSVLGINEFPLP